MTAPSLPLVVAIDGPAGSGKSSVSKAVAERLGFAFLDTGAAYRALAWLVLERGVDETDADAVAAQLADFAVVVATDPHGHFVQVGDTDVSEAIREPRVTGKVSAVARVPRVREHLTNLFRDVAAKVGEPGIVVEGRDITTVVAPDAPVRILLTASEEARMARRSAQITTVSAESVADALRKRDRADSQVVDFMTAAAGVTTVDSTHLDFDQTVDAVIDVINTARTSQ